MDNRYNYVFYNFFEDYYQPIALPLDKLPFVKVYGYAFKANKFLQKLFILHWSAKINRWIKLPLKRLWFKKMIQGNFDNSKPCCYVFLTGKYILEDERLYKYIKSLNPDNKAVVLCGDLISKKNWDMQNVNSMCDMVLTYDRGEAEKYDIEFYPWEDIYGAIEEVTTPAEFETDVYFLGFAKDRLEDIHNAYKVFSEAGLRCKFIICGTQEKDRVQGEGLYYTAPISYRENLRNVNNSRCILEVIQGGSCAPTLRLREACTYKRKLISNNTNPVYREQLDCENLFVYSDASEVDPGFAKAPIAYEGFTEVAQDPMRFIGYLEKQL